MTFVCRHVRYKKFLKSLGCGIACSSYTANPENAHQAHVKDFREAITYFAGGVAPYWFTRGDGGDFTLRDGTKYEILTIDDARKLYPHTVNYQMELELCDKKES